MKSLTILSLATAVALILCSAGCSKEAQPDASAQLQQSFQTAEPEVQKAMQTVTTSLQAGNYTEATRALAPVVAEQVLTDQQREAVGVALQQINSSVAADPSLDTKEMYEMRARMFRAVHNPKKRF
jgi:hypothetical protein